MLWPIKTLLHLKASSIIKLPTVTLWMHSATSEADAGAGCRRASAVIVFSCLDVRGNVNIWAVCIQLRPRWIALITGGDFKVIITAYLWWLLRHGWGVGWSMQRVACAICWCLVENTWCTKEKWSVQRRLMTWGFLWNCRSQHGLHLNTETGKATII